MKLPLTFRRKRDYTLINHQDITNFPELLNNITNNSKQISRTSFLMYIPYDKLYTEAKLNTFDKNDYQYFSSKLNSKRVYYTKNIHSQELIIFLEK